MPPPPPRRRFQIHLSTAIVLMFVAGALMWVNMPRTYGDVHGFYGKLAGWPRDFAMQINFDLPRFDSEYAIFFSAPDGIVEIRCFSLLIDFGLGMALLSIIWLSLESLIHRRSSKKGP